MENESNNISLETREFEKNCWICFETEAEDREAQWLQPCKCKGTSKWVHQTCLQRWIDEQQRSQAGGRALCPQCKTEYIILYPDMGTLVDILDTFDNIINKSCLFLSYVIIIGAFYWSAMSYGGLIFLQIVGIEEGFAVLKQTRLLILIIRLPAIPFALIVGKMFRWEDTVITYIRRHLVNVPLIRYILPLRIDINPLSRTNLESDVPPYSDLVVDACRFCGALLLPTFAIVFREIFFNFVKSNFYKTVLGGLTFIVVKGALSIYRRQHLYVRQCLRRIRNHSES